jgi:hypothetical protein
METSAFAPKKKKYFSGKDKWIILGGLALVLLLVYAVFAMLGNSDAAKMATTQAQSDSRVVQRLGQPVKRGLIVMGNIQTNPSSGRADLSIPLSGPKAEGTLYAVAVKSAGVWKFETLQLEVDGDTKRIDLLANGQEPDR